eukprot:gene4656-14988_t
MKEDEEERHRTLGKVDTMKWKPRQTVPKGPELGRPVRVESLQKPMITLNTAALLDGENLTPSMVKTVSPFVP